MSFRRASSAVRFLVYCAILTELAACADASPEQQTGPTAISNAPQSAIPRLPSPLANGRLSPSPNPALSADRALGQAFTRVDRHLVSRAEIQPGNAAAGPGVTIAVTLNLPTKNDTAALSKAEWEADLLCGATAEAMAGEEIHLKAKVGTCQASAHRADDSIVPLGGGFGNARAGQMFTNDNDTKISSYVHGIVQRFGMRIASLQVLRPRNAAIALAVSATSVQQIAAQFPEMKTALDGGGAIANNPHTLHFEGVYVNVLVNGKSVGGAADAPRVADSYSWGIPQITGHSSTGR